MGGQGTGPGRRLKQYLDEQLPGRITNGDIAQIEGALLYSRDVREISFAGHVVSSLEDTEYGLSMVRQRKGEERGCSPSKATPTVSILRCRTR